MEQRWWRSASDAEARWRHSGLREAAAEAQWRSGKAFCLSFVIFIPCSHSFSELASSEPPPPPVLSRLSPCRFPFPVGQLPYFLFLGYQNGRFPLLFCHLAELQLDSIIVLLMVRIYFPPDFFPILDFDHLD